MRHIYIVPGHFGNAGIYRVEEGAGARPFARGRIGNLLPYGAQQQDEVRRQPLGDRSKAYQRSLAKKERRKVSRRIIRKRVLLELRSGIDRRRRNQRESDIVEHIDEKV